MNSRSKRFLVAGLVALLVVGCGTLEDWFGRTDYAEDAVSYLDVERAVERGDWFVALSPQWSLGYPLLLAATRWMFPALPEGEWTAIHVLNLLIFVASYLSFLYLLRVVSRYLAASERAPPEVAADDGKAFVFGLGTTLFLLWQLLTGNVSRVSPDPLIAAAFFLVVATCLRFLLRPTIRTAAVLGLLMGVGYVIKAAFLPDSALILLVLILAAWIRSPGRRLAVLSRFAWAPLVLLLVALPYVTALSEAVGTLTLGQSGDVNYAWSVNHLPQCCHWQGGPEPFGAPLHPTRLVLRNPPVFTFGEPFPVTYPPWFAIPYFYEGFHHFFSLRNQLAAIWYNSQVFRSFFLVADSAIPAWGAALVLALGLVLLKERRTWWRRFVALLPLPLFALLPIGLYLLVHIEPRYVIGPIIVLVTTPFLPLFLPTPLVSRKAGYALLVLVGLASAAILALNKQELLHRIRHDETYADDPAWKLGGSLAPLGVHPGDKVAAVGFGPSLDVTWAYVGDVHIVAEIGNDAFDWDHQAADLQLFTRSPDVQRTVFQLFRQAGAVLVVARGLPEAPAGSGWLEPPGTGWWIHSLAGAPEPNASARE